MNAAQQRLEQLRELARRLRCESDLDAIVHIVVRESVEVLEMDRGVLLLDRGKRAPETASAYARAGHTFTDENHQVSRTVLHLVRTRLEPVITPNVQTDARLKQSVSVKGVGAVVGLPLIDRSRFVGALYLDNVTSGSRAFGDHDRIFLQVVSEIASLSLANARTRARMAEASRLSEDFGTMLDTDLVLERLLERIVKLTNAEQGFLLLHERERDGLKVWGGRDRAGAAIHDAREQLISRNIVERVATSGEAYVTENVGADKDFDASKSIAGYGLRSVLCVPVRAKGTVLGVLYLENRAMEGVFGEEDTRLVQLVADRAGMGLENARLFAQTRNTVHTLANAVEARDLTTSTHVQRVSTMAVAVGKRLGLADTDLHELELSAILHDVGKIGIPDGILLKPGKLETTEWDTMKTHPQLGVRIVHPVGYTRSVTAGILCHHEAFDGSGYPQGLSGRQIPLFGRIIAIADVFDALISDRPYKKGFSRAEALDILEKGRGTKFDPRVLDAFLGVLAEERPTGPTA
jgi:HD-GYP domain-containing protein (c-di-GMP phosphodiesterase class II)